MPRTVTKEDFAVRSVTDPSRDVLQDVTMFINRGDDQVSLTEQSDGVRQLMSMTLFDLAEGAANVLAIDEPEIHLHPTSQRTAADLLSGKGNQKFIVTHSPYVLHRFEPSESSPSIATAHAARSARRSCREWRRCGRTGGRRGSWKR